MGYKDALTVERRKVASNDNERRKERKEWRERASGLVGEGEFRE